MHPDARTMHQHRVYRHAYWEGPDERHNLEPVPPGFWRGVALAIPLCLAVWGLLAWLLWG